jgi:hypothetical protein
MVHIQCLEKSANYLSGPFLFYHLFTSTKALVNSKGQNRGEMNSWLEREPKKVPFLKPLCCYVEVNSLQALYFPRQEINTSSLVFICFSIVYISYY